MRHLVLAMALFAGCAGLPAAQDDRDPCAGPVRFAEEHHRTRDAAFRAAADWLARRYPGGANAVLGSDAGAGTLAARGTHRWSKPIDTLGLHFHEGTVDYTLALTIDDRTAALEFRTGAVSGDTEVGPRDLLAQLVPFYQGIKDNLMQAIAGN